jgi:hypothetical protein
MERIAKANANVTANNAPDTKLQAIEERLFYRDLKDAVPDWKSTFENDAAFKSWVSTPDKVSGQTPQHYLDLAATHLDVDGAVAVFEAFKATTTTKPTATKPAPSIAPAAAPVASAAPTNKKMYSLAEWSELGDKLTKGRFGASDSPKAQEIMNELDTALKEGRVKT